MTNKELAQKLLDLLGGKDNVLANAACMTRLRVTVKDTGNVDTEGIKALDGVMGLVEDDTMQIVLGPGKVNKVLEECSKLTGLAKGVADESVVDAAATNKAAQKAKVGGQAVLGRQLPSPTPWLTERHGYDPTSTPAPAP